MKIQWYPGHMTKAIRMMQESVKLVDSVIYVIDSRAVYASFNDEFDKLIGDKPILYIINKSDLVERADLKRWIDYFRSYKKAFIVNDSTTNKNSKEIIAQLRIINKEKIERYARKGAIKSVRAMVVGVPNCGKSTLINSLCGGKKTITGDRPGVTRGKQWVVLTEGVELLDTPGTLPPNLHNQEHALHLAFIGSVKEDVLNILELAIEIISYMRNNKPAALQERFKNVEFCDDDHQNFLAIGLSRGMILRGGVVDEERTAKAIVDDFKKQRIGKIMLEFPEEETEKVEEKSN